MISSESDNQQKRPEGKQSYSSDGASNSASNSASNNASGTASSNGGSTGRGQYSNSNYQGGNSQGNSQERQKGGAMEVIVDHNIEKAMKILKRKLIKEGLFKELKSRRYYEKPSERKKRKLKESLKKVRKDEARAKKNSMLF